MINSMEAVVILIPSKNNVDELAVIFSKKRKKGELAGGKIEEGETLEEAAIREAKEETGLIVSDLQFIDVKFDGVMTSHLFLAKHYEGEITDSDEGRCLWMQWSKFLKRDRSFLEYSKWAIDSYLETLMIVPENLTISNSEYFENVVKFAKSIDPTIGITFFESLNRLALLAKNNKQSLFLYKDFAPYSFEFGIPNVVFGGIIFHGQHDGFGNGSAPTYTVCLNSTNGWSVHT